MIAVAVVVLFLVVLITVLAVAIVIRGKKAKQNGMYTHFEGNRSSTCQSIYVGRKAWICAIRGLRCVKRGSALCTTIHGLSAQSADCAIHSAQSTDLRTIHELARAYCGSVITVIASIIKYQ